MKQIVGEVIWMYICIMNVCMVIRMVYMKEEEFGKMERSINGETIKTIKDGRREKGRLMN